MRRIFSKKFCIFNIFYYICSMLTIEIFKNAYHNAMLTNNKFDMELHNVSLGFLEACLVHFGVITPEKSKLNDFRQEIMYVNFLWWEFYRKETKSEVILRLSEQYLNKENEKG